MDSVNYFRRQRLPLAALVLFAASASAIERGDRPAVAPAQASEAWKRASRIPHPRFFQGDAAGKRLSAAIATERAEGLRRMQERLDRHARMAPSIAGMAQEQPSSRVDPKEAARAVSVMNRELAALPEFALAWHLTRNERRKDELLRRLEASADALEEVVSRKDVELVSLRSLIWAIALALDIGHEAVPQALAAKSRAGIAAALRRVQDGLLANAADPMPNASRYHTLGRVCAAILLHAGEIDGDKAFIEKCLPAFLNRLNPYGGPDGGQFDGTSYTVWGTIELLLPMDIFKRVGGIDAYAIPWVRNVGEFFTWFVPPGAPAGAFGDGAEVRRDEEWSRFTQQIAARVPSPLLRWAASNRPEADRSYLGMLLAPMPDSAANTGFPKGTPNARLFPSIGWAAMHSSLESRARTSVLFKASPFGAVGHGHADQNSFSMSRGGEAILIDSGVYDWYGSPHSVGWYRKTMAHNAMTHDGGAGQMEGKPAPDAGIRDFWDDGQVVAALGSAAGAYGPGIRESLRALVFIRPDTVLVRDISRADSAKAWEFNFHTRRAVEPLSSKRVKLRGGPGDEDVCISVLTGPEMNTEISSGFPAPPEKLPDKGVAGEERHIRFAAAAPASSVDVLTAISFGCAEDRIGVDVGKPGEYSIRIGGRILRMARDGKVMPARAQTTNRQSESRK